MEVTTEVIVDLSGIANYRQQVDSVRERVYKQWTLRYRTFVQKRFDRYSRGGGNWPALKTRVGSILRDTNTLFQTMAPTLNAPSGSINRSTKEYLEIGFSGGSHPGGPTIAQIAFWHHTGAGNLPVREIIVLPDGATLSAMVADMDRALNKQ